MGTLRIHAFRWQEDPCMPGTPGIWQVPDEWTPVDCLVPAIRRPRIWCELGEVGGWLQWWGRGWWGLQKEAQGRVKGTPLRGGEGNWAIHFQSFPDGTGGEGGVPACFWFIANLSVLILCESGGERRGARRDEEQGVEKLGIRPFGCCPGKVCGRGYIYFLQRCW